jgi:ABC-2 type transport system ATP-binding protein
MPNAIETNDLSKRFGDVLAVDAMNLRVRRGEIYGFLGLNGAGKTTTIRALLGLIRPTAGTVTVLGQPVGPQGRGAWRQVGHLVEAPTAYPELTVTENLEIARRLHHVADRTAVSDVVARLNLGAYAHRRAGTLSTGNLQRLGLARALLHRPELLILDEPASGLDPAGVVEIRDLLAALARDDGVTVFMSSHILTEVDRLATRIGIIHHGRLIEELDADRLDALRARRLEIRSRSLSDAQRVLTEAGYAATGSDSVLTLTDERAIDAPDEIAAILVKGGASPTHLAVAHENLEDHFMRLTGGGP